MGKHTANPKRLHKKPVRGRRGPGSRNWLYLVFSAVMVLVIGLGTVLIFGGGSPQPPSSAPPPQATTASMPSWIQRATLQVREAYVYAAEHPETISYIPCYCGCGQHDGHRSANDCFVDKRGADGSITYDPHGAGCEMCVDIALITKSMLGKGSTLAAVRKAVDAKYSIL
ncbi:MAG: PCYCGC motif-containing (lipo)protein, partial [Chloroflexota bacterium]